MFNGLQSRPASSGTASRLVPRGLLESNRRAELVLLESFWAVGTIAAAGLAWLLVPTAVDAHRVGDRVPDGRHGSGRLVLVTLRRAGPASDVAGRVARGPRAVV